MLRNYRNKAAAAAAAKSETQAKVQRAEQILEAQQKRYDCYSPHATGMRHHCCIALTVL